MKEDRNAYKIPAEKNLLSVIKTHMKYMCQIKFYYLHKQIICAATRCKGTVNRSYRRWNDRDDLEKSLEIDQGSCALDARAERIIRHSREK